MIMERGELPFGAVIGDDGELPVGATISPPRHAGLPIGRPRFSGGSFSSDSLGSTTGGDSPTDGLLRSISTSSSDDFGLTSSEGFGQSLPIGRMDYKSSTIATIARVINPEPGTWNKNKKKSRKSKRKNKRKLLPGEAQPVPEHNPNFDRKMFYKKRKPGLLAAHFHAAHRAKTHEETLALLQATSAYCMSAVEAWDMSVAAISGQYVHNHVLAY